MSKTQSKSVFRPIIDYVGHLSDQSPYWKDQSLAWGFFLVVLILGAAIFAVLTLSSIRGGGSISYQAIGSPGPVTFRHVTHMTFENGKYKDCKVCHDKLFASQKYGTYVLQALKDSAERKIRIGRDASTLYMPDGSQGAEATLVTYEIPRACATCATGTCHDGKESFSRMDCLKCHQSQ